MTDLIKKTILYLSKYLGLFYLTKLYYRNRIRILCYHGFSIRNEELFVPGLFIKPDIFDQRMKYLKDKNFNVISLEDAYQATRENRIDDNSVVITIDDGFYSTYSNALPVLKKYGLPSTLYVTSYYFDKDSPIFTLAVNYMFFNSRKSVFDLSRLGIDGLAAVTRGAPNFEQARQRVIDVGQAFENHDKRIELLRKLGVATGEDYEDLNNSRILNLINKEELKECAANGMDIELHTHRHRFPTNAKKAAKEITKNRAKIDPLLPKPMSHFCYPSGEWSEEHWSILESQNIKTSTTCDNGLITAETPVHAWSRFLDSARISQIEYESELCGFTELLRKIRGH